MATTRTMKHGHLYMLEGGSNRPVWTETPILYPTGFVDNSGNGVYLGVKSGDLVRKSGGDLLAIDGPTSTATVEIDETHAIVNPIVWQDGSNTHLWIGYDSAGGSAYTVYYTLSTDAGETWGARTEVIPLGAGATWNDVSVVPIGVYKDTTDSKYYIHVIGNDGSVNQVGRFEVGTAADLTSSGNYSAYGSNPVFPTDASMDASASVVCDGSRYHIYGQHSSTVTQIWHAWSDDGLTWTGQDDSAPILESGITGTGDDAYVKPTGSLYRNGYYYLFYEGNDGSGTRAHNAVGVSPDKLYKVGNIGHLPAGTNSEVYYCLGDLTWAEGDKGVHVMDRNKPGCVVDAAHADCSGSFSFYQQAIGPSGVAPAGLSDALNLWADMMLTSPSVNEPFDGEDTPTCHILYRLDNDAGTAESFFLFLRCSVSADLAEGAEGNLVTGSFLSSGDRKPYEGDY